MLSSLFGDLRSIRGPRSDNPDDNNGGFAATALMESTATEVNDHGQMVDSHQRDLVVSGSAAQAIRDHFANTRADLETATRQITLLDPTGVWATAVIKALSDATGRPVERLHLRQQGTLRTLGVIERTTLERRNEDTLRIYHTEVRAPGNDNAALPVALMERSHMTAVIVGAMAPHAIDDMLETLQRAVTHPNWRCPTLMFMLPPNAVWIANKVAMYEWPAALKVQVLSESLTSASAVWNALLGIWNRVKTVPTWQPPQALEKHGIEGFPIKVADLPPPDSLPDPQARPAADAGRLASRPAPLGDADDPIVQAHHHRPTLAAASADRAVAAMGGIEGLLGCAVVDAATGFTLARHSHGTEPMHLELAAAGSAQVLRAHQQNARGMGLPDDVDEVMTSAGQRHHVMRTVSRHPGLFLFALLDKQTSNLALARYKLMEAEQGLD